MCNSVYYRVLGQTITNIIVADAIILMTVVEQLEMTNCILTSFLLLLS